MRYMYRAVFVHALAVLLAGCAATPPTQYAQGVPVAPRAPSFSPTLDAPITVGQPGYVGPAENLPRSPHGRVLPQTPETQREPGLWVGDQPRGSFSPWSDREPIIVGVVLPEPTGDDPEERLVRHRVRKCAYRADTLFNIKMRPEDLVAAPANVRACLAAYAFRYCAKLDVGATERLSAGGIPPMPSLVNATQSTAALAEKTVTKACANDEDRAPWLTRWFGVLVQEWSRFDPRSSP